MNHGSGWVLIEEHSRPHSRRLITVLPPRKSHHDVAKYVEQLYVALHASTREKLIYKKNRKLEAYAVMTDSTSGIMHCGHEPSFTCIFAQKIILHENSLEFHYRIDINHDDPSNPTFQTRHQSIAIEI